MGMGIGAAMTGLRVIIEGMNMGFLLLAYNQISNNAGMLHYTSGGQYKVLPLPPAMARLCHTVFGSCSLASGLQDSQMHPSGYAVLTHRHRHNPQHALHAKAAHDLSLPTEALRVIGDHQVNAKHSHRKACTCLSWAGQLALFLLCHRDYALREDMLLTDGLFPWHRA